METLAGTRVLQATFLQPFNQNLQLIVLFQMFTINVKILPHPLKVPNKPLKPYLNGLFSRHHRL